MKGISRLGLFALFLFLVGCKEKETIKDDSEIRYKYFNLEKSGWKSSKYTQKVDDIGFTATEVPLPYYILKEIGNENLFNIDSIHQANNRERIIEFEFAQDDEKDLLKEDFTGLNYKKSVEYMSFSIEKDFVVVTSKNDTIRCSGATFERNFKVAPYQKIILFFTGIAPDEKIQLVYNDKLFNKGTLKFKFEEKITKLIL